MSKPIVRRLFRQAQEFEALTKIFERVGKTEKDKVMAKVSRGLAEVCMMLAEKVEKEES